MANCTTAAAQEFLAAARDVWTLDQFEDSQETLADVDEIGRGAAQVLAADPGRHVWGLGRHWIGSNNFWYLRDPAGNFAEYHSDLDVIDDDAVWEPGAIADLRALYAWAPPVPPEFILPNDIAARAAEA